MGKAFELIAGFVTAPSTTFTALTMATGSSLTVRNAPLGSEVRLMQCWSDQQVAGNIRIRSPKLHDNVQGIRLFSVASEVEPLFPMGSYEKLIPQDVLVIEMTGSATAADIESFVALMYYSDLPGTDARLITPEEAIRRMSHIVTVENTLALGTAGGFSGEEAINAEFDLLKANTDYALVGYLVSAECACVRWRGADTGNLGVGGPGNELRKSLTAEWFITLSKAYQLPLIPVFNSANKGAVLLDGVQDENGTDTTVTSIFYELGMPK